MPKSESPKRYTEQSLAWELFGGRTTVIVVLAMLGMALVVIGFGVHDVYQSEQFQFKGVRTQGKIIEKVTRAANDPRGQNASYQVLYSFKDANGVIIHASANSREAFSQLNPGDAVTVEYLPGDSNRSRLVDFTPSRWVSQGAAAGFAVLFAIAAIAIGVLGRRSARKRARIYFHGDARPGQIVSLEAKGSGRTRRLLVTYQFTNAVGVEQVSKPEAIAPEFFNRLKQGQTVTVLIDPQDSKRHELDYFGIRS